MTQSLDDQFTPHLDEEQLTAMQVPGMAISLEGRHLASQKLPATDQRSIHDAVLQQATKRYAKLLRRVAYPYGSDPYTHGPLDPAGNPVSDKPTKPPKALQQALWGRSYKKAYKKLTGGAMPKGARPLKPSFKKLYPRGGNMYTFGTGIVARGTCARGGSVLATVASLAAPLILKGVTSLATLVFNAIKKSIEKRKAKKAAELAASTATPAATESTPEATQDTASAQGAGKVPTPYQAEQAKKIADDNASKGRIGFPNPLSFPEYPPSLMDPNIPIDALTFWRDVYNKVKLGLMTMAEATHMPPKYALPYIDKFIRAHARKTFGRGGAKLILDTLIRGKPLKVITPFKLLYPVLEHSVNSPEQRALLYKFLKRTPLTNPVKGEGLNELLEGLTFFLGSHLPSALPSLQPLAAMTGTVSPILAAGKYIASYIMDTLRSELPSLFSKVPYGIMDRLSKIMGDIATMPSEEAAYPFYVTPEPSSSASARGAGLTGRGEILVASGGSIWDMVKQLGFLAGEIGAPILGALASDRFGKSSKALEKAFEVAGNVGSEALGEMRVLSEVASAKNDALAELEKKKKELEDAAALTPDLYTRLKREAEMGRLIADQLKSQRSFDLPSEYAPMKKWKMTADPYGSLHRSYLSGDTFGLPDFSSVISRHKQAIRGIYGTPSSLEKQEAKKAKESKKLKKLQRKMDELRLMKSYASEAPDDALMSMAEKMQRKRTKKIEKKIKKKGLKGVAELEYRDRKSLFSPEEFFKAEWTRRNEGYDPETHTTAKKKGKEPEELSPKPNPFYKGTGMSTPSVAPKLPRTKLNAVVPTEGYKLKPVKGMSLSVGPTTDAAIRGRQRAGQVLMLAKKMV